MSNKCNICYKEDIPIIAYLDICLLKLTRDSILEADYKHSMRMTKVICFECAHNNNFIFNLKGQLKNLENTIKSGIKINEH